MNRQRDQVMIFSELAIDREIAAVHRIGEQPKPVFSATIVSSCAAV